MIKKVFKTGDQLAVSLPGEAIELLGLHEGSELSVAVDVAAKRILFSTEEPPLIDIDAEFARQLAEFIEQYRPALAVLAR